MSEVFGADYASSYDILYGDKDYESECDLIEHVVQQYELARTHSILDLGCGTGNHALPLARRGYSVSGVDRSEKMLALTRTKAEMLGLSGASFHLGDIRTVNLGRKFDVALMMFAVLGYQSENKDAAAALKTARSHLNPGGILIFDVWYGPAVLNLRPSERSKIITTPEEQMVRFASGNLDIAQQICTVTYQIWRIKEDRVLARVVESHRMRYFFDLELDLLLESAAFTRVRVGAFPEFDKRVDENTWNVLIVAQAV